MESSSSTATRSHARGQWRPSRRVAARPLHWRRLGHARLSALVDFAGLVAVGTAYAALPSDSKLDPASVVAFGALTMLLIAIGGLYRKRMTHNYLNEVPVLLAAAGIGAAILTFFTLLLDGATTVADQAALLWLLAAIFLAAGRGALRFIEIARWTNGKGGHPTVILGAGKIGHLIARRLLDTPELGLRPIGFVDDLPMEASEDLQVPILGPESDLEAVVLTHNVEHAILSFSAAPHERTLVAARRLDELGVTVSLVPRLFEGIPDRTVLDRVGGVPVISIFPTDPRGWQLSAKYVVDRILAGFALGVLSPLLLLTALLVLLDSGRPILFRQRRIGIDGQEFEMLKFRTMRGDPQNNGQANADWADTVIAGEKGLRARATQKPKPNSRVTRLGKILRKTAIDELPQLINVASGDMSLIGPRPEMPQYASQFEHLVHRYGDRHRVKSGITGWAQVNGLRGRTSLSDRVEWDNYYIENWSPWLDLKIMLMTVVTLIRDPSE